MVPPLLAKFFFIVPGFDDFLIRPRRLKTTLFSKL